jgi:hypothetical protein
LRGEGTCVLSKGKREEVVEKNEKAWKVLQ